MRPDLKTRLAVVIDTVDSVKTAGENDSLMHAFNALETELRRLAQSAEGETVTKLTAAREALMNSWKMTAQALKSV